jgi:hypothetical protein
MGSMYKRRSNVIHKEQRTVEDEKYNIEEIRNKLKPYLILLLL